jgi:hypothetical protein
MLGKLALTAVVGTLATTAFAAPASAHERDCDHDGYYGAGWHDRDWRWRDHEWREHERWEREQAWRRRAWQERHAAWPVYTPYSRYVAPGYVVPPYRTW